MKKLVPKVLAVLMIAYAALLIPEPEPNVPVDDPGGGSKKAFAWNQDELKHILRETWWFPRLKII